MLILTDVLFVSVTVLETCVAYFAHWVVALLGTDW